MASSVFNLGEVIGAFDRPRKPNVYSYLDPAYDSIRNINTTFDANRTANQGDFNDYLSAFKSATPQFGTTNQSNIDYINMLLGRNPADATANYKDLLGFNLGQLNSQQNVLDQAGSRNDNLALAALGLGGNAGGGSYGSLARTNRISANTVPILNTIFANTGQTAQSLSDQNYRDTLMNLGLLNTRSAMVDQPANRLLAPQAQRNAMIANDTGLLNGIVNSMKNNVLGMSENTSGLGRFANATKAVDKSLNSALDTYMSMYSGGMMGGGGAGGMMGGMGGGGQGGGMNINQIMQMLNQSGRGGGYASGYERSNPYGNVLGMSDYSTGETQPYANSFYYP